MTHFGAICVSLILGIVIQAVTQFWPPAARIVQRFIPSEKLGCGILIAQPLILAAAFFGLIYTVRSLAVEIGIPLGTLMIFLAFSLIQAGYYGTRMVPAKHRPPD